MKNSGNTPEGGARGESLALRPMSALDLDRVLEIETQSFAEPWTRENFEYEIESCGASALTVALSRNKIVGYSVTWFLEDEFHLANVAVRKDCRGQGIGRALVEEVMDRARLEGIGGISLEVRESNVEARKLYETLGFRAVGLKRGYYKKEKEDAILMRWLIGGNREGEVED